MLKEVKVDWIGLVYSWLCRYVATTHIYVFGWWMVFRRTLFDVWIANLDLWNHD